MSKKSTKDPKTHIWARHLDLVYLFWTIYSIDIVLDHKNEPVEELLSIFHFFHKIQDGIQGSKIEFRQFFV